MTRDEAWNLANHWVEAWNSHDLDRIMTHYEDAIELTSPVAARLSELLGRPVPLVDLRIQAADGSFLPADGHSAGEVVIRVAYSSINYKDALAATGAARILRREAQMDPLLLTGAVRVALGQLSGSTQVRLRVPAAELDLWSETAALFPRLRVKPVVLAGEGMRLGDCTIETELGSVDLGIRAQLGEIERGFFDRSAGSKIKTTDGLQPVPAETCS